MCRCFYLLDKGSYNCYRIYKLCSEHFVQTDFKTNCGLNSNFVPSVFSCTDVELKQTNSLKNIPEESIPSTSGIMAVQMIDSVDINSESLMSTNL